MRKKILMVILLSSISLAGSYKVGNIDTHKNGIQSTYINDAQNRLEHKRLLGRQLSIHSKKENSIIAMELKQKQTDLLLSLFNN